MATKKKMTLPEAFKTIDRLALMGSENKELRNQVKRLTRQRTAMKGWITRLKNAK